MCSYSGYIHGVETVTVYLFLTHLAIILSYII